MRQAPFSERDKQELDQLAGIRRSDGAAKAAVRLQDLQPILEIPPRLKSAKAAGATPTKAEHDALVDDINAIHRRLVAMAALLQQRILP